MAKTLSNTTNLIAKFSIFFSILFLATFLYTANPASAAFVDDLIEDMGDNDATLMNAPPTDWSQHAYLDMGFAARGDATPQTWANAQGGQYTSSEPWQTILPWFQIWPVEGNSGTARVQVSNIQAQVLIGGSWQVLELEPEQWSQIDSWDLIGGKGEANSREEGEGVYSYLVENDGPIHGGLGRHELSALGVNPSDIEGVAISAVAEITEGSGEILFEIGGDYHPNMDVQVSDFALQWGPAIGGSKFALIDGARCIYMTTIDPPGAGEGSAYSGKKALTHAELAANPPQDLCDGAGSGVTNRPTLEFTSSGVPGTEVVLEWKAEKANTCTASGGTPSWGGEVDVEGEQTITDITKSTNFSLTCEGDEFRVKKTIRVSSQGNVVEEEESTESTDEGGGSEDSSGHEDSSSDESDDSDSSSNSAGKEAIMQVLNLLVEKLLQLLDLYTQLLGFGGSSSSSSSSGGSSAFSTPGS